VGHGKLEISSHPQILPSLKVTNITPENQWLEDKMLWPGPVFRGKKLVSGVVKTKTSIFLWKADRSWSCEQLKSAVAKQTGDKEED